MGNLKQDGRFGEMLKHYGRINEKPSIFILGVLGRSSSTALQRLLNSSHEIHIFGESKGILGDALSLLDKMETHWRQFSHNYLAMNEALTVGGEGLLYPNAINLGDNIPFLRLLIANLFNPGFPVDRIGFKDIDIDGISTLRRLANFWENHRFLFLFRNPISQFESAQAKGYWTYSADLPQFLSEYVRLSTLYMEYVKESPGAVFIENTQMYDKDYVSWLFRLLEIRQFDDSIIGDRLFAASDKRPLESAQVRQIQESLAWERYQEMKARTHHPNE